MTQVNVGEGVASLQSALVSFLWQKENTAWPPEMKCYCGSICKVGNAVRLSHFIITFFIFYVMLTNDHSGKLVDRSRKGSKAFCCEVILPLCVCGIVKVIDLWQFNSTIFYPFSFHRSTWCLDQKECLLYLSRHSPFCLPLPLPAGEPRGPRLPS